MASSIASDSNWTTIEKILFRFVFILFGLFIVIENNATFPPWQYIMYFPLEFLHQVIPWIGKNILHLSDDITVFTNGSGDTTYDYVLLLVIFCLSIVGTLIWSVVDKNSTNYIKLYYWLTVAVRFYVGLMLIQYGMAKVLKTQFPYPDLHRLGQPYGESSPMGLAWTFLGFSYGYNLFMGVAELTAVLLLFRRTVTIGAIITLMTAANVMAVNYFYDVPVKIISTALVVMTLFLLSRDVRPLFNLFFKGEKVQLNELWTPAVNNKLLRKGMQGAKFAFIGFILIGNFILVYGYVNELASMDKSRSTLLGEYKVDSFNIRKNNLLLEISDTARWKSIVISETGFVNVKYANDSTRYFQMKADTSAHFFEITNYRTVDYFQYVPKDATGFLFTGKIGQDSVSILLSRTNKEVGDFLLMQRGFHWINEYPFNR